MLWGYYVADTYVDDETEDFAEDMEYIKVGKKEVSALPLTVQFGQYGHFVSAFNYGGRYHYIYTELGKTMFRKAYVEEVGDMEEEEFEKLQELLLLDLVEISFLDKEGGTRTASMAYKVKGDVVSFYEVEVDEDEYTVELEDEPAFSCNFLHEGGKLIMAVNGLQREYVTYGNHEDARMLSFSGYALNDNNRYEDLDGFYFTQDNKTEDITVYVSLAGGEEPVDAEMEYDKESGEFTLSWTERWVNTKDGLDTKKDKTKIEGVLIPCESYGFTNYSGFFMFIDGECYKYLMSQEEYEELMTADMDDSLSDEEKEELAATKRDILAELVEAFKAEGIEATVDYTTGQVSLKSNFLFATDSAELSQKGVDYVDAFMRVYTSVIMKEEYAPYVSQIIVEGHTDTSGSYSHNLTLSQKRAESVVNQCVASSAEIASLITAHGCSYDYPVFNEDGSVNMEQSRRVTFRFVLSAK